MSADVLHRDATLRLPLWRSIATAYRELFGNLPSFLAAAALPCAMTFGVYLLSSPYTTEFWEQVFSSGLSCVPAALFEIAWYRFLLIRSRATRPGFLPRPGRRFLPYLGFLLLATLLNLVAVHLPEVALAGVPPYLAGLAFLLLFVAATYLILRLSFVFAWIAIDQPAGLMASWRATAGNGLRLLIAVTLADLPVFLGIIILMVILGPPAEGPSAPVLLTLQDPGQVALLLGTALLILAWMAVNASIVAQAFGLCTDWQSNRDELLERFE
jgi:hypothetical protein